MAPPEKVTLRFEGPAVADGAIDVKTLADTLMAFQGLVDAANKVVNGDDAPPIEVRVKSISGKKDA